MQFLEILGYGIVTTFLTALERPFPKEWGFDVSGWRIVEDAMVYADGRGYDGREQRTRTKA